jgi:CubicO group peptidase (beta-lactamase class C family)
MRRVRASCCACRPVWLGTLLLLLLQSAAVGAQSANEWPRALPAERGLDGTPLDSLVARARAGVYGNTDALLVVRDGRVVVDVQIPRDYREVSRGRKSAIGCGIDACASAAEVHEFNYFHPDFHPYYRGSSLHTLQSVTKSVTATLFGIALRRGQLRSLSDPLLERVPRYAAVARDPRLRKATLLDLLTMRTGIEWHETDRPLDSTNTTSQLEWSKDWNQFTLSQPMDAEPGTKWVYNSGGSALMAEVLREATGVHADEYARRELFDPLGITFHWKKTPTGHPDTEGGLYLAARDLARIGQLYLDDGVWRGRRLLPAGWAREATARVVNHISANPTSPGYGYQWWRYDRRGAEVWAGNGFGGQFLVILPAQRMVGVANSWNVFGAPAAGILIPLIDAMLDAAGVAR